MKTVTFVVGLTLLVSGAQAQNPKEKYELSERCGKQAAEVFAEEWGEEESSQHSSRGNYESHYNSRLNKCFYLETLDIFGTPPSKMTRLFDLNENRMIGEYIKRAGGDPYVFCRVRQKRCKSEAERR